MSLGGSSQSSSSSASSNSVGYNQSQSYLDPNQAAAQQQLVGGFNEALGAYNQSYQPMTNQLLQANLGFTNMQPTAGMQQLNQFAQQGNPYLQQSIDQFGNNLATQFGRTVQNIGGNAQLAGQRGSSRHGIAEGMAFEDMMDTYQQGVTQMQSDSYNQQQAAAGQYAGLEAQQAALAQQAAMQGLSGIGQAGVNYFNPFMIGAGVIGAPSVLQSGYGFDVKQSEAESKGKGGSVSIGFGD